MDVFVIPISRDRYELYCETESSDPDEAGRTTSLPGTGGRHWPMAASSSPRRLRRRFSLLLKAAEQRQRGETEDDEPKGWAGRAQDRMLAWVASASPSSGCCGTCGARPRRCRASAGHDVRAGDDARPPHAAKRLRASPAVAGRRYLAVHRLRSCSCWSRARTCSPTTLLPRRRPLAVDARRRAGPAPRDVDRPAVPAADRAARRGRRWSRPPATRASTTSPRGCGCSISTTFFERWRSVAIVSGQPGAVTRSPRHSLGAVYRVI